MKILTRYIVKAVAAPLLGGIITFTCVLLGVQMLNLMRAAEKLHLSLSFTLELLALTIPQNLTIGASISVLLGILLGLGNLTGHSETIAMRAGGLSYKRIAIPIIVIGLLVSVFGVLLNEYVVPVSLQAYEQLRTTALTKEASGTIYQFYKTFQDNDIRKLIYADAYEPKDKELKNVLIQEMKEGKLTRTISAEAMYWNGEGWYFTKAQIYQYTTNSLFPITVDKGRVHYELSITPKEIEQTNVEPESQSISDLKHYIDKFTTGIERQRLLVELNNKLAIPFASLVFAILGTPLALRPQRRSKAAGFGLCIIYILIWYVLMGIGDYFARTGSVPVFLGAWLPNIALAGYGVYVFCTVKS
jgi:lipopolysaccharide export system permease protein